NFWTQLNTTLKKDFGFTCRFSIPVYNSLLRPDTPWAYLRFHVDKELLHHKVFMKFLTIAEKLATMYPMIIVQVYNVQNSTENYRHGAEFMTEKNAWGIHFHVLNINKPHKYNTLITGNPIEYL